MGICCRFVLVWLLPLLLSAHPHVFVEVSAKYDADRQRLYMQWLIDDFSSALIKVDYDTNKNDQLEPQEAKAMLDKKGYAILFYRSDFFLHPKRTVENLDAAIIDGRVSVTFETDAALGFVGIWDEEFLFSFHAKDISGMKYTEESEGYFGFGLEL